ncbi:FAD-dependent oxidoreductase [Lutibacter sp. TH_r2]|uniref:FAD-dependent oxidoreductase n=1 Tax=Lutibacter sp. TH_r2 TaxID=3082083 RepID=UPI00295324C6|nr:FAD-dependent oxidoreductase [Lutibacter sp. TH_r2]MDV7188477.1 FAD-dependent oxidoreductase [Lutibacter sp. TH_r2]
MSTNEINKKHYVAIIGGSISGSEAASILANNGFRVVVFEMNKLPYGKIEDGLPSWHINLRNRQINEINSKLNHPNIQFIPNTKIGEDIEFEDLVKNWGFSAIILANGAWNDRLLPIPNADKFRDKELVYQNEFIYWFNHKHEPSFEGKNFFIKNNTVVFGGGLASLDVVKIVMIELVKKQLYFKKDIDIDIFTIEKKGIDVILEENNCTLATLEIEPAKLVYRRSAREMPLKSPKDQTQEKIEAAKDVSEKLLNKYVEKYLFEFIPLSIPKEFVIKNQKLNGVILQKNKSYNGKLIPQNEFKTINTEMVISSIGSIPEQIEGLEYDYAALKMKGEDDYRVYGFNNVFAIGNAVTGRGNIQESKQHGKRMTQKIIDVDLTEDEFEKWLTSVNGEISSNVNKQMGDIVLEISKQQIQPETIIQQIAKKTKIIHKKYNYKNYLDWVQRNLPIRLEEMI